MSATNQAVEEARRKPPLRVGVNLLWLVPGVVGGSEEYTTGLLRSMAEGDFRHIHLTLFTLPGFTSAHPELAARLDTVVAPVDGADRSRRVLAESTWLPRVAGHRNVDLIHHAGGVVPPGRAIRAIPSVLTIHDLQPLVMPENFSVVKRRWLRAMLPSSARAARLVITPSDPTGASVVERLGVARDDVRTVSHGLVPRRPPTPDLVDEVRRRYGLSERMVLYPAITYPHKDHVTLVEAFSRIAAARPDATLVLTGGAGPAEATLTRVIRESGAGAQIRRTGRIPRTHLDVLYSLADAVAIPSRFEGFGLPALEAMAAGAPLVVADATALPWVVGDAAALAPIGDVAAWARALDRLLGDPAEADRLRAAGRARADEFTWERSGAALAEVYDDASPVGETGAR